MPLEQIDSASSMRGQLNVCVWHSWDVLQLDANGRTVSARWDQGLWCCCRRSWQGHNEGAAAATRGVGTGGSQDEAEKGAEDVDPQGHEDRPLSHGRGLTSHWRITALLFQDYLLKVQNVCSLCEVCI